MSEQCARPIFSRHPICVERRQQGEFIVTAAIVFHRQPEQRAGVVRIGLDGALGAALEHSWPQYAAYAVAFLMIGIWWINHSAIMVMVGRVDRTLLFANIGLLACIAFLPFPTSLFSHTLQTTDTDAQKVAAFVYSLNLVVISLTWLATWLYLSRRTELLDDLPRQADAQPHADADDRPRQPRVPREGERADRRRPALEARPRAAVGLRLGFADAAVEIGRAHV